MPDLGKYADTVLLAYGVTLVLLVGVVVVSVLRGRRVRAEMRQIEARSRGRHG